MKRVNGNGGSGEPARGAYCTPKWLADAVGAWDLDPFANPRSHVVATRSCALERGDDGLIATSPGAYYVFGLGTGRADESARVWIQPPYEIVDEAIAHYGHTRFCALLRFDPSTKWFQKIYRLAALVCVPRLRRIEFEPPPGVKASKNPYPHALFYARAEDATPRVLRACIAWRTR